MSFDKTGLDSYNDVASRLVEFRSKYPDGSLQPVNPFKPIEVMTIGDKTFLVYTAAAYRTPDDQRPGIGVAWEPFPGRTPYTRDSEIMVLETSAWGRAIVAALAADTRKGVASADEIRNRQADRGGEYDPMNPAAIKKWARDQQARKSVIGKAEAAIQAAETVEALDVVARRITEVENEGRITADDEVSLRQKLVAKREVIAGGAPDGS